MSPSSFHKVIIFQYTNFAEFEKIFSIFYRLRINSQLASVCIHVFINKTETWNNDWC